jgi:hypothetical protein
MGFLYKKLKKDQQTTSTQNFPSSHDYGCSVSHEIPCLLENLRVDYHYKTLNTKT